MATHTPPPQDPHGRRRVRDMVRGLLAVLVLVVTGLDALITACLGVTPLARGLAVWRREIGDEYRRGAADAIDAEVICEISEVTDEGSL